jgi:hypothetical protein
MRALKLQYCSILLVILLSGCLGDSNSSTGSSSSSSRISYSGSTDPATLTQANSAIILGGAYQGGQTGNAFGSAASLSGSGAVPQQPRILILSQVLAKAIQQIDLSKLQNHGATVNPVSNQVAGNCGGQLSYTGTVDDASRQFYANFTFTDYCQDSTTFTGIAAGSGQTDDILVFSTLSLSFDALTVRSNGDSFTANGYEIITPATSSFDVSMNMLLQDDTSNLVYRFDQLKFKVEQSPGYVDLGISSVSSTNKNRYYDPRYGYVELSTPTILHIIDGDYWPTSGLLKATGSPGSLTSTSGINTSASFTALSNTVYQLDVDIDGDGVTDSTTTGSWSDL